MTEQLTDYDSLGKELHKSAIAIPSTAEFQQVLDNLTSGEWAIA
ncbi:hypothetical protein [uncultured Nostoc sp.]